MRKLWSAIFKFKNIFNLSEKNKITLLIKLKDLLDRGYTLSEACLFLIQYTNIKNRQLKLQIETELNNGAGCAKILRLLNYPKSIVTLINFAEIFGDLTITLPHAYEYLVKNYKSKQRFLKTIQYPALLLIVFLIMLIILNHTIIPEFQNLYSSMDVSISPLQLYLSLFITNLPSYFLYSSIIFILIILGIFIIYRKSSIEIKHKILLSIPIISKFFKYYKTFYLASELSLFYKNGITLQKIVEIYAKQQDEYLIFLANEISKGIQQGLNLSEVLKHLQCFEKNLIIFVEEGEKKGRLEIEMKLYSEMILSQIEQLIHLIIKFIQPIVFSLIAILIVSLYLVIMLPMFDLMQTIK
ncbi:MULTISPECIES: competence type IV pilus assembly protein ComGB [Staphylococcus]|uniref:competence type IV pilus assembly protein ComGB n=1 Tax=Staphylococcus TaxID=1279 RepID=UPI000852D0F2|nr:MULTISPECIES: competence type IV pilus assembly protein ComGB [Staphylococcus]MBN6755481.1 type II secretion system F family protein [Staphylococcus saprophyticus]MBN6765459.1 type II secretion system F family protein [Staphylococcus saprophyticus]MBN6770265.1 type II secretion system F family protein [Staphylococcus saprophyticus]MBN6779261.1 type II secretion system F family protein [Staphylococcus saprophyticus]MBN6787224.1 type II secretion system F family protein [Staphylococcus saprop